MSYFIPRNGHFYATFIAIKPAYRYLVTAVIIGVIGYGWFVGIYSTINNVIATHTAELVRQELQRELSLKAPSACKQLEQSIAAAQSTVRAYSSPEQDADGFQHVLSLIIDSVDYCGLALTSCTVDQTVEHGWYVQHILNIDIRGTFDQVLCFFDTLARQKEMIGCQKITCALSDGGYTFQCAVSCLTFL